MAELPVSVGTVIAGRYRVDAVIGAGSMGIVAAAYNLELEQAVAIKFLSVVSLATKDALARFRHEVRAAAKIKSEHVARVLDVGALESGLPYMVMEYLEGHDLEDELALRGSLPVEEAALYVLQAIEAIAEAHAASVVHRDLKPANLFLATRPDQSRLIKVLDFGISKTLNDDPNSSEVGLTRTGMVVGSPLYMAPEQLGSIHAIDWRADIWGLGGILFQLVTGRTPFNASSAAELYAMLLRDPPTPLSHYRDDLPAAFEALVLRCLERDPSHRFVDVSALADALLPFAPPAASVHAERARGVLHAGRASGRASAAGSQSSRLASASPVVPSNQRASQRPRASTNGETTASWGKESVPVHRRIRQWVAFAALSFAVVTYVGVELWLTHHEPEQASTGLGVRPSAAVLSAALQPIAQVGAPRPGAATEPPPANPVAEGSSSAPLAPAPPQRPRFRGRPAETGAKHPAPDPATGAVAHASVTEFGPRK